MIEGSRTLNGLGCCPWRIAREMAGVLLGKWSVMIDGSCID